MNEHMQKERLILVSKIILPNVSGRIDHIAYDSINHLAFVAALGNNSVEVVNIISKQVVHTIAGLREPQGVVYISSLKKIIVANGGNGHCDFFDAITYKQSGSVDLKSDADNIRYDPSSQRLYIGHGNGAIAVIDANSTKQLADIKLDGHPESFQLLKKQNRIYVNVPDADEIQVADLSTNKIIATWKNMNASSNFPMALDEKNNRLFIGYRSPARLRMINAESGNEMMTVHCSGDADDVFYNASDSVVLASAGEGYIDVFKLNDGDVVMVNHIKTSKGARTSLLLASEKKFLLAVPARAGNPASLWIYNLQ